MSQKYKERTNQENVEAAFQQNKLSLRTQKKNREHSPLYFWHGINAVHHSSMLCLRNRCSRNEKDSHNKRDTEYLAQKGQNMTYDFFSKWETTCRDDGQRDKQKQGLMRREGSYTPNCFSTKQAFTDHCFYQPPDLRQPTCGIATASDTSAAATSTKLCTKLHQDPTSPSSIHTYGQETNSSDYTSQPLEPTVLTPTGTDRVFNNPLQPSFCAKEFECCTEH